MLITQPCNQTEGRSERSDQESNSNGQANSEKVWQDIQELLWRALAPYPEARLAVARELEAAGDGR